MKLNFLAKKILFRKFAAESLSKVPFKAKKVTDNQVSIFVENANGYYERVKVEVGKSLQEELVRTGVKIGGSCKVRPHYHIREKPIEPNANEPTCGFCLIEVQADLEHKIYKHPYEKEILIENSDLGFDSTRRLACCITVEPWMEQMKFRIPIELPTHDSNIIRE